MALAMWCVDQLEMLMQAPLQGKAGLKGESQHPAACPHPSLPALNGRELESAHASHIKCRRKHAGKPLPGKRKV